MSDTVKLKAVDTLHISALGPNNIAPGEEFEVAAVVADDLEKRGLAKRTGAKRENKSEPAPANKMEPDFQNKADQPESDSEVDTAPARRGRKPKKG